MIDIMKISASAEYKKMEDSRQPFHTRAKDASKLTIAQMYPDSDDTASTNYPTPYQSLGARGVNNLANKMILSLFPPATAFFKLGVNPLAKKQSGVSDGDMQNAMYTIEKGIVNEMEVSQLRATLVDIIKQGVVGGSAVLYVPEEGRPRAYPLPQIGVKRSRSGVVIKMVLKESVNFLELPSDVRNSMSELDEKEMDGTKDLSLYTLIVLDDEDKYQVVQEVKGMKIQGTEASYLAEELPYVFVPFC